MAATELTCPDCGGPLEKKVLDGIQFVDLADSSKYRKTTSTRYLCVQRCNPNAVSNYWTRDTRGALGAAGRRCIASLTDCQVPCAGRCH
jgi:hypothetical protein